MHPELFHFGPIHLRSFGTMMAVAFLVGTWLSTRSAVPSLASETPIGGRLLGSCIRTGRPKPWAYWTADLMIWSSAT